MPYQLTIRLPHGKGWRLRTTSASEFVDLSRHFVEMTAEKLALSDLVDLWPDESAAALHRYGQEVFHTVLRVVREQIARGQFDVLDSGRGLLAMLLDDLRAKGWSETCTKIGLRIAKIVLSLAVGWLRTQFPVISERNYPAAITALSRLIQQRGGFV